MTFCQVAEYVLVRLVLRLLVVVTCCILVGDFAVEEYLLESDGELFGSPGTGRFVEEIRLLNTPSACISLYCPWLGVPF